jgi:hypothetical protein
MDQEREKFLNLREKPARVTVEEAAWILRCAMHDIPILVANGLLKPLGHPVDNATKFFAYDTLQELKHDLKWLARVTDAISEHWKLKNARKSENAGQFSSPGESDRSGKSAMQRA